MLTTDDNPRGRRIACRRMNSTQLVIAISFTTLCAVSLAIALRVIRSTSEKRRRTPADIERMRERENVFAVGVIVALVALMGLTVFFIPYGETADGDAQVVNVESFQFGWQLEPNQVQAGRQVEFRARSRDVQHGFGIYDGTKLLAQVQVPGNEPGAEAATGAEQRLLYTFDEPGTYEVLCLEFCGVQHHNMTSTFEVVP